MKYLEIKETPSLVFLDHDLGNQAFVPVKDKNTGSEAARWLSNKANKEDIFIIHSLNSVGADYMHKSLTSANLFSLKKPFCWDNLSFITTSLNV